MSKNSTEPSLALAGRLLIAALFLPAGLGKVAGFATIAAMIGAKGLPLPQLLAAATIALEIAASLALVAGFKVRWAALALAAFTLLAGLLFHDFWAAPAAQAMAQSQAFFKNVAIAGGLLLLAAHGPGRFSWDGRRAAN
ncbi:MAG TPA: DoxX family protein [Ramlibacter sp.]|nr:DoxX family protein [Ramlibacter sp.]